jgi:hypothetical protein
MGGISLRPDPERSDLLRKVIRAANDHLIKNLDKYPYLIETRGLTRATLFQKQVGYIDPEGEALRASGLSGYKLLQLGMLRRPWAGETNYRSFFAGRFIFPIRDQRREPVQLKGRANPGCVDTEAPKSLCFPTVIDAAPVEWGQSNIWDYLYNEEVLKEARHRGYLFLCEGETDTLTLVQQGLLAVGLPGNQGLERHYRKFTGIANVYDIRDNDSATEDLIPDQMYQMQLACPETRFYRVRIPELAGPGAKVDVNDYFAKYGAKLGDLRELTRNAEVVGTLIARTWGPLFENDASMAKIRRFYQASQGQQREQFFKSLCTYFPHDPGFLRFTLDPASLRVKDAN